MRIKKRLPFPTTSKNKNKLQVRRFRLSCSLLILFVQLTAHSDTCLTAVIAGKECQWVIARRHLFHCGFSQCFQLCHLIGVLFSIHGLQRDLIAGLQIGKPTEMTLVIMSRNDQIVFGNAARNIGRQYPSSVHRRRSRIQAIQGLMPESSTHQENSPVPFPV